MIELTCNIDSRYVRHCAVTLVSAFKNNPIGSIRVHILANGLSENDEKILQDLGREYQDEVCFYSPDDSLLADFKIQKFSKRISLATYYRCMLAELLPVELNRVIYLDCDMLVLGNLAALWNCPLDGVGVAAVEDDGCHDQRRYENLMYDPSYSYFNAGMLLINLDYWRTEKVWQACADFYHRYPERVLFNDQDLLNRVLHDHKKLLDLKWNAQDGYYRNNPRYGKDWYEQHWESLLQPVILHYTNRKPWEYSNAHPLRGEYFRYQDLTVFRGEDVRKNPLMRVRRFFRLLPFTLHIRKAKYIDFRRVLLRGGGELQILSHH